MHDYLTALEQAELILLKAGIRRGTINEGVARLVTSPVEGGWRAALEGVQVAEAPTETDALANLQERIDSYYRRLTALGNRLGPHSRWQLAECRRFLGIPA